jgi:hypothetical protein
MLSTSLLNLIAPYLLFPAVSTTLLTNALTPLTNALTLPLSASEVSKLGLALYTDITCSGGQLDREAPEIGCYDLAAKSLKVEWFADTCQGMYAGTGRSLG